MNVNDVFPSKYLKAHDLGGKNYTLTIRQAKLEELGQFAEKESCLVLYFIGAQKGLVCNRTNAMTISDLYTPETDNWIGKRITLYATQVRAFGKVSEAIRVKPVIPPAPAPAAPNSNSNANSNAPTLQRGDASDRQSDEIPAGANEEFVDDDGEEVEPPTTYAPTASASVLGGGNEGAPLLNPFDDPTAWYQHAFNRTTGKAHDAIVWLSRLHKEGVDGPCSPKEYKVLREMVNAIVGNTGHDILTILCQSQITEGNRPALLVNRALLRYLPAKLVREGVEVANPEYNAELVEIVKTLAKPETVTA